MFDTINELTFKISPYCNLDCVYCFQQYGTKEQHGVFDIERDLLEFIKEIPLGEHLELKITGGESSLFCNDLERVVKCLKKIERYRNVRLFATTISNGTNMEGLLDLMRRGILQPDGCKYSWDGIHSASKSRKPKNPLYTDEFFNSKVKLIGQSEFADRVLIRTALTPDTVDDLADSLEFVLESGCTKWEYYLLTDCDEYKDCDFQRRFRIQLEKIAKLALKYDFNYYNWDTLYFSEYVVDRDSPKKLRSISCRHLGSTLYIGMDGSVYPCGYFSEDSLYADETLKIGNIKDGFRKDLMEKFTKEYYDQPMCEWQSCQNLHCFECPALAKYRKGNLQAKLCQACGIRTIEREIFLKYADCGCHEKDEKLIKMFNYGESPDWLKDSKLNENLKFQ